MKYIKICDGFAIDKKTAWIEWVQEESACEKTKGLFWLRVTIKEDVKFFFRFGDEKQTFTTIHNTKEEALKEWERVLKLINDNYETSTTTRTTKPASKRKTRGFGDGGLAS